MSHSSNSHIQQLMDQASSLDPSSDNIEEKLQLIAQAVALEQSRNREMNGGSSGSSFAPSDPQDAFQCEGCQ